jgi:hypothetical protein
MIKDNASRSSVVQAWKTLFGGYQSEDTRRVRHRDKAGGGRNNQSQHRPESLANEPSPREGTNIGVPARLGVSVVQYSPIP